MQAALIGADSQDASYSKASGDHQDRAADGRAGRQRMVPGVCSDEAVRGAPTEKKTDVFKQISYAEVDIGQERELGQQLTKGSRSRSC